MIICKVFATDIIAENTYFLADFMQEFSVNPYNIL